MRRLLLLPLLVLALAAASPATAASTHTVSITKAGFVPASVTIPNGDSVTWKNNDTTSHQIVSDNGTFTTTRTLAPGESATRIFPQAGTFAYHDASNTALKGTVNVQEVRSVSVQPVGAQKVMFTHAITLRGQVSKRNSNGEEVLVQARPYGQTDFQTVARTTTASSVWQVLVRPRRDTEYRAVWENVPSDATNVFVTPMVTLRIASGHRVVVRVAADVSLRGHSVLMQRLNRRHHVWRTIRSVRLTGLRANNTSYIASRVMRLRVAHGTIVRAYLTRRQAGPAMFGPAWSRSLRA
ncbi:MAG TPA: cupredoxin domain-containing protein [Gaiellaceae bacterium]